MGYKIKEIREEAGMTQAELSEKSGVTRSIINGLGNWENDDNNNGHVEKRSLPRLTEK